MKLVFLPISTSDRIPDRFYVVSMEFLSLSRRLPPRETSLSGDKRGETSAIRRLGHNTPTYRVRIRLATFVEVVQVCSILSFSSIEGVCSIQWLLCHYLSCFGGGFLLLSSSLGVLLTLLLSFNILLLFPEKRLPFPACFLLFCYHLLYSNYSSFTDRYHDLSLVIFNNCYKKHGWSNFP